MYCQLDYLGKCLPGRIQLALDELPETLDETYERVLQEIDDTNWESARRLLLCVAVASRPLRVEELAEILAFDFKAGSIPKFREDWRLEDPVEAVLSTCSTLLILVDAYDSPVIQFSHFSVKEFLTSTRVADKRDAISRRYHVSMTPAHTLVAQACLGILLHLDENITRDNLRKFPLAKYAAEHWFEHACFEGASKNAEEGMKELFDPSKQHLAVWVWIYDPVQLWGLYLRTETPLSPLRTPLHYAAVCGLHSIVTFLVIEHSQDVDSRCDDTRSAPLHLACREGHVEVTRVLVEHGADATAQDNYGWTPLHQASQSGNVEIAWFLIEHGADVTAQDNYGSTPLHSASGWGNVDVAQFLVEHGADVTAQNNEGCTPLQLASRRGNVDLVWFLVDHGADVTAQDKNGRTPLHEASQVRNVDLAWFLVDHGADATAQDKNGRTPLHEASLMGNVDLARFLVEHGADATAQNNNGCTPLHEASEMGDVDLARFLVEHGADATAQSKYGSTPLNWAAEGTGNVDLARFLVEHGADATAQNIDGGTLLHLAAQRENLDFARFLVEYGADVTAHDKHGSTPLHIASSRDDVHLARFLIEHGADGTAPTMPQIQQPTA